MKLYDFLKNIVKYCIPSVVSAIIGILVIPIISRIYPTSDYGKINIFYSVGNMVLYIVLLGLDSAYIRFYFEQPEGIERKQLFQLAFWTGALLDMIACAAAICLFPNIVGNYLFGEVNNKLVFLLGVYIFGLLLFRLLTIETRMENQALLYNIQQLLLIFTNRVSFVLIAFYTTDYQYALFAITISSLVIGVFFLVKQKALNDFKLSHIPIEKLQYIFKFAIPLMPTTVMVWLNNSAAKIVLSGYDDFDSVGVLSIATSVANIFSLIPSAFAIYWSPFIYKNYKIEQDFIKKIHSYICILSIGIILFIYYVQDIIYAFVGIGYKTSQPYFLLIMLAPIQSLLCETTSYGIVLSNNTKYNLYISILAVSFNILFGFFLYPQLHIYAVVIGIAGAAIVQLFLKTVIGQRYYESIENYGQTLAGALIIISIAICNVFTYDLIKARIVIGILVLMLSYLIYHRQIINALSEIKSIKQNP